MPICTLYVGSIILANRRRFLWELLTEFYIKLCSHILSEFHKQIASQVYFGSQHAKIYLMSDLLGINCVTGMSCLFRKKVIEQVGGLKSLGIYLAEDYHLAQLFIDRWIDFKLKNNVITACSPSVSDNSRQRIHWNLIITLIFGCISVIKE